MPRARGRPPVRSARRRAPASSSATLRPTGSSPSATGETASTGAYAYRSLCDSGAVVANGSDAPIEELDPWAGICAAVLRDWRPEQALTVEQALEATTVAPAWLTGDERRRGRLLPGYLADLVVLDRDPLAIPPEELPEVQVVATMVGGRWTHNPPPW